MVFKKIDDCSGLCSDVIGQITVCWKNDCLPETDAVVPEEGKSRLCSHEVSDLFCRLKRPEYLAVDLSVISKSGRFRLILSDGLSFRILQESGDSLDQRWCFRDDPLIKLGIGQFSGLYLAPSD